MEIVQSNLELACGCKLEIIRCNIIIIRFKQYVDKTFQKLIERFKGHKTGFCDHEKHDQYRNLGAHFRVGLYRGGTSITQ